MTPSGIEAANFRFVAQHIWTGTEEYCRAGAIGVVTGVISCSWEETTEFIVLTVQWY